MLLPLYLKMHDDPFMLTAQPRDAYQLVDDALVGFAAMQDRAQFLLKEFHRLRPVDLRMNLGEIKREKLGEAAFDRFFPRTVVVVGHSAPFVRGHEARHAGRA